MCVCACDFVININSLWLQFIEYIAVLNTSLTVSPLLLKGVEVVLTTALIVTERDILLNILDLKDHGQNVNILIFPVFLGVLHYH